MTPANADRSAGFTEFAADRAVHIVGILVGAVAVAVLIAWAAAISDTLTFLALLVYATGLMAMLGCSAAYNLCRFPARRELLRRLDHAAIFVMIAGTYTPFSACVFRGATAVAYTAAVWLTALVGGAVKLLFPRRFDRLSMVLYLAFGWNVLLVGPSLFASLDGLTTLLIAAGGILYSIGAGIHAWRGLPFHNAVWHTLVLIAASCHYAAILHGVVLRG